MNIPRHDVDMFNHNLNLFFTTWKLFQTKLLLPNHTQKHLNATSAFLNWIIPLITFLHTNESIIFTDLIVLCFELEQTYTYHINSALYILFGKIQITLLHLKLNGAKHKVTFIWLYELRYNMYRKTRYFFWYWSIMCLYFYLLAYNWKYGSVT